MKKEYNYFVSYSHSKNGSSGFGSINIKIPQKITDITIVNHLTEYLSKDLHVGDVVILYWRLYD